MNESLGNIIDIEKMKPDKAHIGLKMIEGKISKMKQRSMDCFQVDKQQINYNVQKLIDDLNIITKINNHLKDSGLSDKKFTSGYHSFKLMIQNKTEEMNTRLNRKTENSNENESNILQIQIKRLKAKLGEIQSTLIPEYVDYSYYILSSEYDDIEVLVYENLVCLLKNQDKIIPQVVEETIKNYKSFIDILNSFNPEKISLELSCKIESKVKSTFELINYDLPSSSKIAEVYRHLLPATQWLMIAAELVQANNKFKEINYKRKEQELALFHKIKKLEKMKKSSNELDNAFSDIINFKIDIPINNSINKLHQEIFSKIELLKTSHKLHSQQGFRKLIEELQKEENEITKLYYDFMSENKSRKKIINPINYSKGNSNFLFCNMIHCFTHKN